MPPTLGATRLPLQTGASTLSALVLGGTLSAPAALAGALAHGSGLVGLYAVAGLCSLGSVPFFWRAFRDRASDVVLEPAGLRFEGGPHAGRSLPWHDVAGAWVERGEEVVHEKHGESVYAFKLYLARTSGERLLLADSIDEDETASLTRLGEGISHASARAGGRASAPRRTTSALVCTSCGAPQEVRNIEAVFCGACGTRIAVPEEMRARVAASIADDPAFERRLRRIVAQPEAGRANALIATFTGTAVAGVAYSIWAASVPAVVLALSPLLVVLALAAREAARRTALRNVTARLAASPGGTPGAALSCRGCGAPLPDGGERVLVGCRFCATTNLVSVGLECEVIEMEDEREEVEAIAARHVTSAALVGAAVAASVTALVVIGVVYPDFRPWVASSGHHAASSTARH